ncbi:MAG: biopolymer transporter ExbD, partial [Phenylobacterium sp.]|nr:biopolymer transporter ExbD [Phenylobacterium sp.]
FAAAGAKAKPPELHLRIDRRTQYETLADVMSEASKAGVAKVGFITDPSGRVTTDIQAPAPVPQP